MQGELLSYYHPDSAGRVRREPLTRAKRASGTLARYPEPGVQGREYGQGVAAETIISLRRGAWNRLACGSCERWSLRGVDPAGLRRPPSRMGRQEDGGRLGIRGATPNGRAAG